MADGKTLNDLTRVLLRHGQHSLAECWDLSASEVSRKLNGESGLKLDQLARALDMVGAKIITIDDHITLDRDEYDALKTLARKGLG